jgi:hypothetical protein
MAMVAAGAGVVLLAGCGGSLGHRSVAELSGSVPVGQGIEVVRIEIQNGTVGVDVADAREIAYAGGVRRAADTAAALAELERIPLELRGAPDAADPSILVVTGPALMPEQMGVLGLELGLRLPAAVRLEVIVQGSGHVTVANRAASTFVQSGRGDLRFERCAAAVKAKTGRGMVIAFDHRGDVDIQAMVGDMQVFVKEPGTDLRLVTGQGTVQCYVPPTTGFAVEARAAIGRIGNGFGLESTVVQSYGAELIGRRGDGRTKIVLVTGSGHLSLAPKDFGIDPAPK